MRPAKLIVGVSIILIPLVALAQWQPDGTPISTAAGEQSALAMIPDGAGGAFITWQDERSGAYDVYAQRVNASGVPQWTADALVIATGANEQASPVIASDGSGGAIIAWSDARSGIYLAYAQRVNASGLPQWTANGVPVTTSTFDQWVTSIVADGAGGAVIVWEDYRSDIGDIYAQRLNAMGVRLWTATGVALCVATNYQSPTSIVGDGSGGAIVSWIDLRNGVNYDVYARRINASGVPQWTADGVPLCNLTGNQVESRIASDGAGGAIVMWDDARGANVDIYAQRINATGTTQWTANGTAVCLAAGNQSTGTVLADGFGGAYFTWADYRGGSWDAYALRMNASGNRLWTENGIVVSAAAIDQVYPALAADGSGGVIVTWLDYRNGTNYDVYVQRVSPLGATQWTANGVAISTAGESQFAFESTSDGVGGVIVAWEDYRAGVTGDLYALRVEAQYGYWGHPEPIVTSAADVANDQGGKVAVNWEASGRDRPVPATIDYYSIWRAVDEAAMIASEESAPALTAIESVGPDFAPQVYTTIPHASYYWELVGTQMAFRWTHYSFSASTRADSVAGDPGTEFFMVAAHDVGDEHIAFASNAVSGHSVDNLAPAAPLMLVAQRVGADVQLEWNRAVAPDLRDYAIYRATSTGVTPVPINFLSSSEDTVAVDASAPTSALYYIVTALDVHANQSDPSNEASVGALTGIGNTPSIAALTVLDNMPNPFAGTTMLRVGLPKASEVEIEVFDVAGRRVRSERTAVLTAGWREIPFDARDGAGVTVPSGVYFYRVRAAGETITRKMVIAR